MKRLRSSNNVGLSFFKPDLSTSLPLTLIGSLLPAGFPSPADDYLETQIDLNKHLIINPSSTFFARVAGSSMEGAGIYEGDILIVDRADEVLHDQIAVCVVDGEFTVKRVSINGDTIILKPENKVYQPLLIKEQHGFFVWGKVIYVIHKPR